MLSRRLPVVLIQRFVLAVQLEPVIKVANISLQHNFETMKGIQRGALIVLEGCDRVGKTTQCKLLGK